MNDLSNQAGADVGIISPNGTYPIFVSNPENGAVDVSRKIIPRITFTEPMLQATLNRDTIMLVDEAGKEVEYNVDVIEGSSVALIPKFPLTNGMSYAIKFASGLLLSSGCSINLERCSVKFTVK